MDRNEAAKVFADLSVKLEHEGLTAGGTQPIRAALAGEHGEAFFAEFGGADIAIQERRIQDEEDPLLTVFLLKPDVRAVLLIGGRYASVIADSEKQLVAELDDMAQIVGLTARVAQSLTKAEIKRCLKGRNSCFVKGCGMLITGRSAGEAVTGAILLEKAAMTHILAKKIGGAKRVPLFSAALMHLVYQKKYSKINLHAEAERDIQAGTADVDQQGRSFREEELREQIVAYGKRLVEEGILQGTWGNLAVRLDETYMLATPSGLDYRYLTPDDIVKVELDTLDYGSQRKPTSEKRMHRDLFAAREDVGACIHTHARLCGVFAAARRTVYCVSGEAKELIGEEIRCAGHALPSTKKLSKVALKALGIRNACLLMNHGVVCCGSDLAHAYLACKAAEQAAGEQLGVLETSR